MHDVPRHLSYMNIGIVTQPLRANYGGLLQNYALQKALKRLGHNPITLHAGKPQDWRWPIEVVKSVLKRRRLPEWPPQRERRFAGMKQFADEHIAHSAWRVRYAAKDLSTYGIDAICVGSDQTWRPKYNLHMEDMFLKFAQGVDIPKFAYAASLGISDWEIPPKQTVMCRRLIRSFCRVSVREESGVDLCKRYLGVDAHWVVDPTLLLDESDYRALCHDVPVSERRLFAYVLDLTPEKVSYIHHLATSLGVKADIVSSDDGLVAEDCPQRWLARIRDAAFVVTDSFHGTIFSIIFRRNFRVLVNASRGNARFESLVKIFGIERQLLSSVTDAEAARGGSAELPQPDWDYIAERYKAFRETSLDYLKETLQMVGKLSGN